MRVIVFFFFFSSRRRHTRSDRDWSSDVCSSDLVTSLVDISPAWDGGIELFAKSGMRGFVAPGYASARWRLDNDFELKFAWDEVRGREGLATALEGIERATPHPSRRLSGVVSPMP